MCGLGPVSPPPPRSCRCRGALPARSRAQCSVYTAVVAAAEAVPCSVVEPRLQHGHTHARDTADPRHEDVLGEQLVPPLHRPGHHRQARHRRWDTHKHNLQRGCLHQVTCPQDPSHSLQIVV